jgi:hypothetical protein
MAGHDRITPAGKKFFKEIEELKKLKVRVGFSANGQGYGAKHEAISVENGNGPTIAEIAAWNEFGTEYIPSRPFLRQSIDKNGALIANACKQLITAIVKGEATAETALKGIGALQVGLVQREIRDGGFAPNADSTRAKKGSATPLIDTGRMRQSVHYIIEEKKGNKE